MTDKPREIWLLNTDTHHDMVWHTPPGPTDYYHADITHFVEVLDDEKQPSSIGLDNIIAGNQLLRKELATAFEDFRILQAENYDQATKLAAANEVIKVMEEDINNMDCDYYVLAAASKELKREHSVRCRRCTSIERAKKLREK